MRKNSGKSCNLDKNYSIDKNGCWVWLYSKNRCGYGTIWHNGKNRRAHKYYFEKYKKPIPKKMVLDHLCRNVSCVNPEHLEIVSNAENVRRGLSAKLTRQEVEAIRDLYWIDKITQTTLATIFSITQSNISRIVNNFIWSK